MSITVFADVIVPKRVIAAGIKGRNIRQNRRASQVSGFAQVNVMWEQTLREYELGFIPMLRAAWQDIETLHEITEGGAYGMLLEDPKDFTVTNGVVAQVASGQYQLYKRYTLGSHTKDRKITRPILSGFVPKVSGSPLGSGYSLNVETGVLSIVAAPSASNVTWGGNFHVPVQFMNDAIDWEMLRPASDADRRLLAGPSVILIEIRE